jgi:hypothetical protein
MQVKALLYKALATLSLPDALKHTISTRLIQAVDHSGQANPSTLVTIRMYIQKPEDLVDHAGGNGWGYFLVERHVKNPGGAEGAPEYFIEIYIYVEGQARQGFI